MTLAEAVVTCAFTKYVNVQYRLKCLICIVAQLTRQALYNNAGCVSTIAHRYHNDLEDEFTWRFHVEP